MKVLTALAISCCLSLTSVLAFGNIERIGIPDPDERIGIPDPDERIGIPDPDERLGIPDPDEKVFRILF